MHVWDWDGNIGVGWGIEYLMVLKCIVVTLPLFLKAILNCTNALQYGIVPTCESNDALQH